MPAPILQNISVQDFCKAIGRGILQCIFDTITEYFCMSNYWESSDMTQDLSDSILLTRAKMLNLNLVFKPGIHVGIIENTIVYKAKIMSVDWPNTEILVHFVNFNKRYDKVVKMSEVIDWKTDPSKVNEFKRPWLPSSPSGNSGRSSGFLSSTPAASRTVTGESGLGRGEVGASRRGEASGGDVDGAGMATCGTCGCRMDVASRVACSDCGMIFHADTICVGVSARSIQCLLEEGGSAIRYFCCACRYSFKSRADDKIDGDCGKEGSFTQLLEMVGALAGQVRDLIKKVGSIDGNRVQGQTQHVNSLGSQALQSEIREFHEREKRKSSIIIRGLEVINKAGIQREMNKICQALNIKSVGLLNICSLSPKGTFRATVEDNESRRTLLENVKRLKNVVEYRKVYINRDLTYQQRQQLKARKRSTERIDREGAAAVRLMIGGDEFPRMGQRLRGGGKFQGQE